MPCLRTSFALRLSFVVLAMAAFSGSLLAHHSFAAEFDDQKPVKMTGTIQRVEWQNPHIWFYLDVKNSDGSTTTWGFAGGAPGQLMRRGITKDQLKIGATVVVEGFRSKDGTNNASGGRLTYPDGRQVLTAGSQDRVPPATTTKP
ncbi:MAG TPA: DUF6152 family protein [Bryobacteraceae bacterium]|nr:DUF6152 family protein [Bryobacteraceae bacterium]